MTRRTCFNKFLKKREPRKQGNTYGETFFAHDGTEDVILKVNSSCFELHRYYSTSSNLSNGGKFSFS